MPQSAKTKRAKAQQYYQNNIEKIRSQQKGSCNKQKKRAKDRARYHANPSPKIAATKLRYAANRESICAYRRDNYVLCAPKPVLKETYTKGLENHLLHNAKAKAHLIKAFKKQQTVERRVTGKAVCSVAAKRLLNKALQVRKEHAGSLLKTVRTVQSMHISSAEDFGESCHTASTEPYFYDSAYKPVKRDYALPIDESGKCILASEINADNKTSKCNHKNHPMKWVCTSECKTPTDDEVHAIIELKEAFDKPIQEVRQALDMCDSDCPNQHYTKVVNNATIDLRGHPLVCYNDGACHSKMRILRSAATHFPLLAALLRLLYSAVNSHQCIQNIDNALCTGDFDTLMEITKLTDFETLLSNGVETTYEQCTDSASSGIVQPGVEIQLLTKHAQLITDLEKEIDDYPEHVCCSCECLHQRKSVTQVKLSDNLSRDVWPRLKQYILDHNPTADQQALYMCNYCKSGIKQNKLPPRCVLNGLETVSIPPELAKLDALSSQLIQRAKCYQTVVRLGTYTAKVPVYNSLKACKGTMFFLPLPLNKTLETLGQINSPSNKETSLPDPELYIIVNGKPTTSKVVWRSLVNVDHVKAAVQKLRETNWLYSEVKDDSVDEVSKKVIEIANNASSTMLDKADEHDISGFQAFTIRNLDNKLSTESDIEQYKLLSVREDPIDNRQQYLDVLCFPILYPTGKFGKYHPREVKINHSEFDKSRLLNKDSRFRKDPQYVFYLLWQKEMRELSAGVYNLLKQSRRNQRMTVGTLLSNVQANDEHLDANLSTMLQSVRGTKQYWFRRKSELRCMIREWGSPTLFLTFSCAEYESPDIENYLRKVNDVPPSYNIGKLCTEDPISVSRKNLTKAVGM